MKIILFLLLMAAQSHAGWFDNGQERLWQQLEAAQQATGGWQIIAGILAIGGVILFTVGTALGSKTRKDGKR